MRTAFAPPFSREQDGEQGCAALLVVLTVAALLLGGGIGWFLYVVTHRGPG